MSYRPWAKAMTGGTKGCVLQRKSDMNRPKKKIGLKLKHP